MLSPAIPDSSYGSDTLWNYELGVRTSWWNDNLILNAAIYQIDWQDLQILTLDPVTFYVATRNLSEAQIRGLELEARLQATDYLSFAASYARTEAEVSGQPVNIGLGVLEQGDRLPATPEDAFSVVADWRSPVGDAEFVANASYRFVGDRVADVSNQALKMPSYEIVDLRAGFELSNGFDVSLFVDNVTDEVAINQIILTAVPNFQYWTINRPRTIGLTARYAF